MDTPLLADDQAALEGTQQRSYLVRNSPSIKGEEVFGIEENVI